MIKVNLNVFCNNKQNTKIYKDWFCEALCIFILVVVIRINVEMCTVYNTYIIGFPDECLSEECLKPFFVK